MTHPAPLTPPEADLTGYDFMPLFGDQLFASDFNLEATDAEFRAAVRFWWAAWTQVPAASVPNDEKKLCQLAGFGRDGMARWKKMRAVLMRNFVLCSDGRYYHRVLAPHAIAAWEERKAAIKRGKASGVARRLKRGLPPIEQGKEIESVSQTVSTQSRNDFEMETNKGEGEGEGEKPNTAFPVITTSGQPPPNSGIQKNAKLEAERPGMLKLLAKHRVMGVEDHPLIVDRILTVAKADEITQAFHEAGRAKGGAPYDIGFYATIVERIAEAAHKARDADKAANDARLKATQDQIAEQRVMAENAVPMPEALQAFMAPKWAT